MEKSRYKKWGNNEFHDPKVCENCEYDTCPVCDNGPRGDAYKRAEARRRLADIEAVRFAQEMGRLG